MRFVSQLGKTTTAAIAFATGALCAWTAVPLWRAALMALNQPDYALLVEQCDVAMRDHYRAKRQFDLEPGLRAVASLKSGELGLLVCQDYDLYQKRLMQWGLREEELAQMRLEAIEARSVDLQEVINTHEISF